MSAYTLRYQYERGPEQTVRDLYQFILAFVPRILHNLLWLGVQNQINTLEIALGRVVAMTASAKQDAGSMPQVNTPYLSYRSLHMVAFLHI